MASIIGAFAEMLLWLRVKILRFLFRLNDRRERDQEPKAPDLAFVKTIQSSGRNVGLHFYTPAGFDKSHPSANGQPPYPLVIDFHGGGHTAGCPSMDARFASNLLNLESVKPVVVGVDYGLAPETPFPGAVQDAASAITWLATEGAQTYHLDTRRIVLTGFSAGGSLVFSGPMWLHHHGALDVLPHPIKGIVSVYPGIDWRSPIGGPPPTGLAKFMSDIWNQAFYDRSPLHDPHVSIAAADDESLRALPQRIGLYPVALDPLKDGAKALRERLQALGKQVSGMEEPGAFHGFDKLPTKNAAEAQKRHEWFQKIARDVETMLAEV